MIRWFAINSIASNLLMGILIVVGAWCYFEKVQPEVQPTVQFEEVRIDVSYRGGSPEDVETAVVVPIERALENLPGIESIESSASVGRGTVELKTTKGTDPRELLEQVKPLIDGITTFPQETEPPRYEIPDSSKWFDVIKVAISGEMDEKDLLQAARRIRDDLTGLPGISQANIQGASPFELSIEADLARLRDFGMTFSDLTAAIRRSSLDLPAGQIQTDEGALAIRSKNQAYSREDFENIVIRSSGGAEVKVSDVATVRDDFEENRKLIRFNGKPALLVEVLRLPHEDALEIADRVKQYVHGAEASFPQGIHLGVWDDSSIELRGRLGSLLESLLQGSLLVLIILGLFLRPSIAIWVVLGIPISFAGAFIVMAAMGMTLNPMSIFGFIIAVGIVVDDAIVTSENVFTKLRAGVSGLDAAIEGAREVTIPVTFGAITISVAFLPLMFFDGFYGAYARQIPPVVIATILFSLIETKLALPCHLKNTSLHPKYFLRFDRFQTSISNGLETFIDRCYKPVILLATRHRYVTLAIFVAVAMVSVAVLRSGRLGFVSMPSIDRNRIVASLTMPRDTAVEVTDDRVKQVQAAAEQLKKEFIDPGNGKPIILDVLTSTGGWSGGGGVDPRQGFVVIQILDPGERSEPGPRNKEIAKRWQELVGELKDAQQFWISGDSGGGFRGGGNDDELEAIEIELRGPATPEKEAITDQITALLESYPGIQDAWTNDSRMRDELHVTIRPEGEALGLTQRELASQVRAAFFGEEAQRMQRGRDDVRVMVRLPLEQRQSLHTLEEMRVLTPDGGAAPFRSVADARFEKAQSDIERRDGAQVGSVSAKPSDETVDVVAIADAIEPRINALLQGHPELSWRFEGYIKEHRETGIRFWVMGISLLVALYVLLAIPFRSILQPVFVMIAIPYAVLGALFGHLIMDITPSYLSIFGLLALAGVAINDSLVMVDFINQRRREGMDLFDAVVQSGTRRFRPIFLTSTTTFVGLIPTIFDKSPEAQFLNPMAVSIGFGMLFGTFITLLLVPSAYLAVEDLVIKVRKGIDWYKKPFVREDQNREIPGSSDPAL